MVQAKNYKNREEVIADFRRAFARKREWLEQSEKELMNMPSRRKPTVVSYLFKSILNYESIKSDTTESPKSIRGME